ncbi:MAG: hypothetical protein LAT57_05575 [Balneolales bacterium]|nr:hypothetical protein [Balneolales bacterium]
MESVKLNRNRSASEVTVDTIKFIRQNFNSLFKSLLYIAGVPILLLSLVAVYIEHTTQFDPLGGISYMMFVGIFIQLILVYLVYLVGISYVKLHRNRGADNFDPVLDVWAEVKQYAMPFVGLMILVTLSYMAGFALFIIPGIFLAVALFMSGFILVYEEETVSEAYSRSMQLVKGYWWHTFGAIVLLSVVIMGISIFLGLPSFIIGFLLGAEQAMGEGLLGGTAITILTAINYVFTVIYNFFSVISGIGAAMLYFSLREKKEGSSLSNEIAEL